VQRADDGVEREQFGFDARGMIVDEGAAQANDSYAAFAGVGGVGQKEDVVDGRAALNRVGGAGKSVLGEQVFEQGARAKAGFLGESDLGGGGCNGCVGVRGEVEGDLFGGGAGWSGDGRGVVESNETLVCLLATAKQEASHEQDAADEAPEEDALVARDHFGSPGATVE
jgi:hypothetical protein